MDMYPANNANDFQPTTRDPQAGVGTNLQTGGSNLQPVPSTTNGQQSFPTTDRLKVLGVENPGTSTSTRTAEPSETQTNTTTYGTVAGLILLVAFAAALVWWSFRAYDDIDTSEPPEEPAPEPTKPKTKPVVSPAVTTKSKPTKKKTTNSKAKKRKRKSK